MDIVKGTRKYIPLAPREGQKENNLCIEVDYSLGGHNWYNHNNERRGYYLLCTPVEMVERQLPNGECYNAVTQSLGVGNKLLLKEVSRKSKKAEAEAIALAAKQEKWLIEQVCAKNGLALAQGPVIKFYSPIKARLEKPSWGDYECDDEATYENAMDYLARIKTYILESIDQEDEPLGLLSWADEDDGTLKLFQDHIKATSVAVEIGQHNGVQAPMLVYSVELIPGLLPATVKELITPISEELEGQYSDGWGEDLEQHSIRVDTDTDLYIKVWDFGFEFSKIETI